MFSFDVTLIDVAMLIAIVALAALYLSKGSNEKSNRRLVVKKKARVNKVIGERDNVSEDASESVSECAHSFGFLKTRGKNGVPEECVGCARLVECLVG